MWPCGIQTMFPVVVSLHSPHFREYPGTPNQVCLLFHDLTTLLCEDKLVRCRNLLFRTTLVICKFLGILLRFIPWNLCVKMYLRIGEAKNPGPSPGHRPKQLDSSGRAFQTVQFVTANVVSMVDKAPWFNSFDHEQLLLLVKRILMLVRSKHRLVL